MEVLEAPSVDSVFNRPTWRVTLAGPLYVWFDAVIPIVLRVASGSPARGRARMLVEITELVLGTTGPFGALDHPLLRQQQPAMSASRTDVRRLIQTVRSAVPEADNVEVLAGDTTGAFQARFLISTRVGACEVLLDRRDIAAEPYERMKAGLERDGDRRWQLSVDHDRELDPESARLLARRLALSLTDL